MASLGMIKDIHIFLFIASCPFFISKNNFDSKNQKQQIMAADDKSNDVTQNTSKPIEPIFPVDQYITESAKLDFPKIDASDSLEK